MITDLHSKQGVAFLSPATEILYGGAAGGGKSYLMRAAAIAYCYSIPNLQVYLFRRLSDDLNKNHMEGVGGFINLLSEFVAAGVVKIKYSPTTITFWNGSKIFLNHCQYEKDMYKYQGAEINLLLIDELTHFTDSIYRFLRGRCRLGGLEIPERFKGAFPRIICGSNPGGIGHNFVKSTFIDNRAPLAIELMDKKEGGMKRQFIPAKLCDNPTMLKNDPDYEDKLSGLGNESLVKAMRDGDWNIVSGGAFDDVWDYDKHVVDPFEIPRDWYIDRSFDWGSSKPFSVLWFAESDGEPLENGSFYPKGTLFVIEEWYGCEQGKSNKGMYLSSSEVADGIKEREGKMAFMVNPGAADSAIYAIIDGNSIADKMEDRGVLWTHCSKGPGSRATGLEIVREYLKNSIENPIEEKGIYFFRNCTSLIRNIPVLPRDKKKTDDVDSDAEDHDYDALRYRLTTYIEKGIKQVGYY